MPQPHQPWPDSLMVTARSSLVIGQPSPSSKSQCQASSREHSIKASAAEWDSMTYGLTLWIRNPRVINTIINNIHQTIWKILLDLVFSWLIDFFLTFSWLFPICKSKVKNPDFLSQKCKFLTFSWPVGTMIPVLPVTGSDLYWRTS